MSAPAPEVGLAQVRGEAERMLQGVEDGAPLDPMTAALVELAVRSAVSTLDAAGTATFAARALDAGASPEQLQEVLTLVAGLGVHTLMEGTRHIAGVLCERGELDLDAPLDAAREELWRKYVGDAAYWQSFDRELPGFLDALVRLSPHAFAAFFEFCTLPWREGTLPDRTKELIAMATDAMPSHRFLPGLRLHLAGALRRGAGRLAIAEALEIAAATPAHRGVA